MPETLQQKFDNTIPFGEAFNVPFEVSLSQLGLTREEMSGKRILDLGGGVYRGFAAEAGNIEDCEVFTLEPRTAYEKTPRIKKAPVVAGVWDNLPFKNGTFDYVVSLLGLPMWATTADEMQHAFYEVDRVLDSSGEGRFYPPHNNNFWEQLRSGKLVLPPEVMKESNGTQNAYAAVVGLNNLGIPNLSLIPREPLPSESMWIANILVYKK